ncbi:transmembrane protein, putative [Medicago truncatula]|uniref:Transmembrane protein, putative n=1 Tax=Medicago truncatula TaxID=3880 RepID=G7J1B6_MEDTR|nr:transmembrane protein, putative [Medicago truncatula]
MAKHISQYCLLGIFCIALVLASGPTPGSSLCNNKHFLCDNPDNCLATCHFYFCKRGCNKDLQPKKKEHTQRRGLSQDPQKATNLKLVIPSLF